MRFKDQTIIVTGAGYGIGKQIALAFGREGGNVTLAARSMDKLNAVAVELRALGTRPLVVNTNVAIEADVQNMIAAAQAEFGRIDVLVNNSGIGGPTKLARDISAAEWQQTIDVNLTGAFYCAKHVAPLMIEARQGNIVNISSVAGRIGFPRRTPYAASKWGMIGLSHSLAAELGPYGIRVNAVLPGAVEGERLDSVLLNRAKAEGKTLAAVTKKILRDTPLQRKINADEVAAMVLFLASSAAAAITGQAIQVCGGARMQ